MTDETPTNGDNDGDDVKEAATIEKLLESSAERAQRSFEEYVKLGHKAMRRLADPQSEAGSVADDVQLGLGLLARDAMLAIDTWTRFIYLSTEKKE